MRYNPVRDIELRPARVLLRCITVLVLVASPCHSVSPESLQETSGIERLRRLVDETSVSSKVAAYQPKAKGRIDDLDNPAEPILRQLPWVVEVKTAVSGAPQCRIVHLKDWHFIPRDLFAADIRDQASRPISEAEIDRLYEKFLLEVELVQLEQKAILRCLIKHHGLRRVFQEGLTPRDLPIYRAKLKAMRKLEREVPALRRELAETAKILSEMKEGSPERRKATELKEAIEALLYTHRLDLLRIGAAGQLWMTGELQDVLPLDRASTLETADPLAADEGIKLDSATIEARQDAQAKVLTKAGKFAFVILGGAHDLQDNLAKVSDGGCEYVSVTSRSCRRFASQEAH